MDLTMKVQLYYGSSPVKGDTPEMQMFLDGERGYRGYWAVYVRNDVPPQIHNGFTATMVTVYGVDSEYKRREGDSLKAFLVNLEGRATTTSENAHVGGICFSEKMADIVVKAMEGRGYKIEKMYDAPQNQAGSPFHFVPLVSGGDIVGGGDTEGDHQ